MPTSASRSIRWLAVAGLAWTIAAVAYTALRLNFDRAPAVHVRWARTVDDRIRARLEQRFALTGGERESERTWVYFLTSLSAGNIEALVKHPGVEDTHYLDRLNFRVSSSAERRGPFVTSGAWWIPRGLQVLIVLGVVAGAVAVSVVIGPAARRTIGALSWDAIMRSAHNASTWGLVAMSAALMLVWTRYLAHLRAGADESLPFRVGDWLVSYEVGFVRRGLPGALILRTTTLLSAPPESVVLWTQIALYTLLSVLLFLLARHKRLNLWYLAFLFSPAGLLFPLYDPAVVGRKDVLFFVAFALYAWWMPPPDRRWPSVVTFALGAVVTLSHELFFFFVPYFFVMRFLQSGDRIAARRFGHELSLFAGSLLALVLVSTVGADMKGEAQCAVLLGRGFNEQLCEGIMRYPVTTIGESIQYVEGAIRKLGYLIVYPIAAVLAVLPLVPLFRSSASLRQRLTPALVFAILAALAFTIPMAAIALDWGRLLNIHVMAMSVVLVSFLLDDRQTHGSFFGTPTTWLRVASVLLIGVYLAGWSIRHCCDHPFRTGLFE